MKKQQSGFTLIELMIVVAIIGILAAIAIPSYMDYTKRTHTAEGMTLAAAAKTSVAEFRASEGDWPASNGEVGIQSATGNAVESVEIAAGVITITYNASVDTGETLVLSPSDAGGSVTWVCTGGTLADQYLPSNCR
jgi:type IV pilus assembly protein PilA